MTDKNKNQNNAVCVKQLSYNDSKGNRQTASLFELLNQPGITFFVGHTNYFQAVVGVEYRPVIIARARPYIKKGTNGAPDQAQVRNVIHVNWEPA